MSGTEESLGAVNNNQQLKFIMSGTEASVGAVNTAPPPNT